VVAETRPAGKLAVIIMQTDSIADSNATQALKPFGISGVGEFPFFVSWGIGLL